MMAIGKNNQQLINDSKSKFIFVLPPIDNSDKNMDWILPFSNGCQSIAMKFQFYDNNLASYYNFFKSINSNSKSGQSPAPYALKQASKRKDLPIKNNITPGEQLEPAIIPKYFD